uniref:Rootletin-like coiled-coil domain-containing protein n=1 Tax=Meleagris gallopavo TaxID=9103 RepID=A0A803YLY7_MELGA
KQLLHRGMRSLQPEEQSGKVELLDEEQAAYKRKLQAYQEGQQRQAQLVQKLQAKVGQQLLKKETELEQERLTEESPNELENALIRLEEEQQRSCSLVQVNSMLREQLEQANVANAALSEDIRKLTADWARARGELEQREAQWRREEESFNTYFSNEHGRLLTLWRQAVAFRRHFGQLRAATERSVGRRGAGMGWQDKGSPFSYPPFPLQRSGGAGAGGEPSPSLLGTISSRLAELTAALQQLRKEGGEKERAVQALTAQLQKMVSVCRCVRCTLHTKAGATCDAQRTPGTLHAGCFAGSLSCSGAVSRGGAGIACRAGAAAPDAAGHHPGAPHSQHYQPLRASVSPPAAMMLSLSLAGSAG